MLIKSCLSCKYHEIKHAEKEQMSYCARENCWSQYSKCVANKALNRFQNKKLHKAIDLTQPLLNNSLAY